MVLLLLLLPDPSSFLVATLPDGAWRKTMEPQKPGNSPRPGPEVIETESRQRASGEKVCSWTVQNDMRGVLGRVLTGTARGILNSANPSEIRA